MLHFVRNHNLTMFKICIFISVSCLPEIPENG